MLFMIMLMMTVISTLRSQLQYAGEATVYRTAIYQPIRHGRDVIRDAISSITPRLSSPSTAATPDVIPHTISS